MSVDKYSSNPCGITPPSAIEKFIKVSDLLNYLKSEDMLNQQRRQTDYFRGASDQLRGIVGSIMLQDIEQYRITDLCHSSTEDL